MTYTTELSLKVYNDKTGEYVRVFEDGDSLDLIQLSYMGGTSEETNFLSIGPPAWARKVAEAILRVADNIEARTTVGDNDA